MGIVIQSIVSEEVSGLKGACITMVTHGLVSPGLFIISNYIYKKYGTRNINYISGISGEMPILGASTMWMIICNMGIPLSGNFVGEILCLIGIGEKNRSVLIWSSISIIISGIYNIWLCVRILKGKTCIRLCSPNGPGYQGVGNGLNETGIKSNSIISIKILAWTSFVIGIYPEIINWEVLL